jgi:tetratricopeptide (TPR) repeat protein
MIIHSPSRFAVVPLLVFLLLAAAVTSAAAVTAVDMAAAEKLIEAEHWTRAKALLEPLLRAKPVDARVLFFAARVREAAGDFDGARELAEEAVALDPRNADFHCLLAYIDGREGVRAGLIRKIILARRVKKEAEIALALDPRHIEAHQILIEFYRQAPGILGGDRTRSRRLAEELTALDPVRGNLALAAAVRGENREAMGAETFYKKAVEADPNSYAALTALARFYSRGAGSRDDLAEKAAAAALRVDPGRVLAYGLLAQIFARAERFAELDALLLEADKNVPDNRSPYLSAGRILLQQGRDFARAERFCRRYLEQPAEIGAPSHAQAWWRLGLILEKLERKPEALEAIRKALALDPNLDAAKKDLQRLR